MANCQDKRDQLLKQLEELQEKLEKAEETLREIEDVAAQGNDGAVARMSAGNVPMRAYEYCFGQSSAFIEILRLLDVRGSKPNRSLKAKLFSGFGGFKRILS